MTDDVESQVKQIENMLLLLKQSMTNHSIDIRAVSLDLGSYGNRSTRFRDFVVGICESREY